MMTDTLLEDRYVVFVKEEERWGEPVAECEVARCSSYEEAQKVRQELGGHARKCVIRYVGPAGGGD